MISKFSTLHKAERDYSSISQFLSQMKYLGLSASAEEFKTELKKYRNGILMSYAHLLEANNDENNEIPFYSYIFYGQDGAKKWDWLLSLVPVERVEYWLEDKNPVLPSETFHQFVSEHPDLKEVFEKHGFIFTELGGGGIKKETFEWNGFSILNAGFKYRNMERILQELQPTVERIKKHGFGNILYNPIVFVSKPMQGQVYNTFQQQYQKQPTGAYYSVSKDHIVIKATDWDKAMKYNAAFAHELAHRQYYKFLTPTQRQRWEHHFNNRQVDVSAQDIAQLTRIIQSCAPTIYDSLRNEEFPDFSRFNYRKFTEKIRKNPEIKEVLDFILEYGKREMGIQGKNIKTLRREYLQKIFNPEEFYSIAWFGKVLPLCIEVLETQNLQQKAISLSRYTTTSKYMENKYRLSELSGEELEIAKTFARIESLYEEGVGLLRNWSSGWEYFIGMTIKLPYSTSEYGKNNPQEDYAEAFEHFIHNKEMPVDIYREFVALNHIRLGSKKTANINPSMFLRGYCAEFAIALHQKTGFQIVSFDEIEGEEELYYSPVHYAVKHPSGKYMDARGLRTEKEILSNLLSSNATPLSPDKVQIRELYVDDIEQETSIEEEALTLAEEYITSPEFKKVLPKKTAKLSPKEEMQIDALQKRIDTLYRKKDYEEAENLEEKLEALLNDLEAREEHFNMESDESEDFYGWKNRLTETGIAPDLDDENSNPSLEEELGKLYYQWINDDYRFEDTTARKDWQNAHPGSTWKDVPQELQKSEKVFVELLWSIIADTYPSHWDDKPRKMEDITFEEALAAAKDAYEAVTKRRDRTRKLLKKT